MIEPGQTLGILGSGHLARLYALAARALGCGVHVYSRDAATDDPAIADRVWSGSYLDTARVEEFGRSVQGATFVSREIPVGTLQRLEALCPVTPHWSILHLCQNRERIRIFLRDAGLPCPAFVPVRSAEDLARAVQLLGLPCSLLCSDIEGDAPRAIRMDTTPDPAEIWARLGTRSAMLEPCVEATSRFALVVARRRSGQTALYPIAGRPGGCDPLDLWVAPARCSPEIDRQAGEIARELAGRLRLVGVLGVEFVVDRADQLLVGEVTPHPHDAALYSMHACLTDEFEQGVRAACDLPLGKTELLSPAATVAIGPGQRLDGAAWSRLVAHPHTKVSLYGPPAARRSGPLGHFTVFAGTTEEALAGARAAAALIGLTLHGS